MTVKLTDVAKKAGVSPTTVSRVINRRGYISQETIDKVEQAMRDLHYQPNTLARSLQGKQTYLIGLVFPSIRQPFFAELVERLEFYFFERGYKCILCDSENQKEKERSYLNMLAANKVDGIIAGAHNLGIEEYNNYHLPIISFDRALAETIPIVSSDNYQGGELAATTLINKGCQKIGIITGANNTDSPTVARLGGFITALQDHHKTPYVYRFQSHYTDSLRLMEIRRILQEEKLDGLFCTDDLTAITVYNEACSMGIHIPKDLKLIGYDGTQFIQRYFPKLSTIAQPIDDEARLLCDLLCQQIEDNKKEVRNYELPVKLIIGDTI